MKKYKIIFWVTTLFIFFFEGVMSLLTSGSDMAIQGITHLGYPVYFATILMVFKVFGSLALVIPMVPDRIKEWAYAGFMIDFICAFLSLVIVDGFGPIVFFPIVVLLILLASYHAYHKIKLLKV